MNKSPENEKMLKYALRANLYSEVLGVLFLKVIGFSSAYFIKIFFTNRLCFMIK